MFKRISKLVIIAISFNLTFQTMNCVKTLESEPKTKHKFEVFKSEEEWRKILGPEAYKVLREKGTERPFTNEFSSKEQGYYVCAACGNPLFSSKTKFDSGTGWPSFYEPLDKQKVGEETDKSWGMTRTEVHCNRCGGHLGHVFDDGPVPSGLRYCINGIALKFVKRDQN